LGYGLYPFNAVALDRMVRTRQEKFNPRDLLAVMSMTLTAYSQEMEDGRFPSLSWARNFEPRQFERPALETLAPRVQRQIDEAQKSEQRSVLLTFWGGVPEDFRNLSPGIHEAFDVPVVSGAKMVVPRRPKRSASPKQEAPPADQIAESVRSWRDGVRLDADHARVIRRVLQEAIIGRLDAEDALISQQFLEEFFDRGTDIAIVNSAGSGKPALGRFRVDMAASNDNALLFEGILKMQEQGSWDIDDGPQTLVTFLTLVDREAGRLETFVRERLAERHGDRSAAVALLALTGLIAGRGGVGDGHALLAAAMSVADATSNAQPALWRTLIEMTDQRRAAVRDFALQGAHVSKSTTEPAGVDGRQFSDALRSFATNWKLPTVSEAAPRQLTALHQLLDARLAPALSEAHGALRQWREEVVRLVGDPDSVSPRYKEWRASADAAQAEGFLVRGRGYVDDGAPPQLGAMIAGIDGLLERWPDLDLGRRVTSIAKVPWGRLGPAREHLAAIETTLAASAEKARTQQAHSAEGSPIAAFERALDRLETAATMEVQR
jgi:hypothetical protein